MSSRALPIALIILSAGCLVAVWHMWALAPAEPPPDAVAISPAPPVAATAPEGGDAQATPPATPAPVFCPVPTRYAGQVVSNRVKGFPDKLLALTFDDGPSTTVTPRILETLREHGARATFFQLGSAIAANRDITRRVFAEGHAVANHSYSHPSSTSEESAASELERTATLIRECTGHEPELFRPPYGITKGNLQRAALSRGYVGILWTISAADTDRRATAETIATNVIHTPNPGDIVLMHDSAGHGDTAEALPRILEELGAAGFRFVTVPELLDAWDKWLEADGGPDSRSTPPG